MSQRTWSRFYSRLLGLTFAATVLTFLFPKAPLYADANLTLGEALQRSAQVSDVHYDLKIDLSRGDKEFYGDMTIDFNWKTSAQDLRIDFNRGHIIQVKVNDKIAPFLYNQVSLQLKPELFKLGANAIQITYKHAYSKDGSGLYRFVDPEDKNPYLYSNFEPYEANQMYPSFDQPDLKARFKLSVTAPKDWTVVSATREFSIDAQKNIRVWTFPESLPMSTYVFSLHAGPYKIWEDAKFRIPLRVLARQSMAQHVRAEEWLSWTRYGFDFFESTFGTAYPFLKYDQIMVPDFNSGAMENVAAVTFNERFAPQGERSAQTVENNFNTVLHEMAHVWFGDLVTMRWWDDLWLNESFATYASAWALASHPDYKHAWISFHREKNWGYAADRLSTTHPIVSEVADTDVAGSNFDGITYGKGASWLKLLAFRVGEKDFSKGLQAYFKKHAFANTTVDDLIGSLEDTSGLKLQDFAKPWLHKAGLNSVEVRAVCSKDAKLNAIEIVQSAPETHPDLRSHSMSFALYGDPGSAEHWLPYKLIKTDYEGAKTTFKITDELECPILIFPNSSDDDFVKIIWPLEQFPRLQENIARIADPMQRTLFWESLGWALEDGETQFADVIRFVSDQLPLEKDYAVLGAIGELIENRILPALEFFPDRALRMKFAKQLAQPFQSLLIDTKTAKDFRLLAFDLYIPLLGLSEDRDALAQIYEKKTVWPEFSLDQPRRWKILAELAALRDNRTLPWAKTEKDPSNAGTLSMRGIEASLASGAQKSKIISDILKPGSRLSRAQVRATLSRIFPAQQISERLAYRGEFLKSLALVSRHKEDFIKSSFTQSLLPVSCEESDDAVFQELLKLAFPAFIRQDLLERRDSLKYCRTIRTNAGR